MTSITADDSVLALLPHWQALLQGWALDGSLGDAAREALQLDTNTPGFNDLVDAWADGDFCELPLSELGDTDGIKTTEASRPLHAEVSLELLTQWMGQWLEQRFGDEMPSADAIDRFAEALKTETGSGLGASETAVSAPAADQESMAEAVITWLRQWASQELLAMAAETALGIDTTAEAWRSLVQGWLTEAVDASPDLLWLSSLELAGVRGAYDNTNNRILISADWAAQASGVDLQEVFAEELGHWLDAQFNSADTPGD